MKVNVRYFSLLREAAGKERETVEVRGGSASAGDLLRILGEREGRLGILLRERPILLAVNEEYAGRESPLSEGDEVALFPPVSGG